MRRALLLLAMLCAVSGRAQAPQSSQMLNLSCVESLVAIGHPELAGVFSFVSEKDGPAAFADLVLHDRKALKKYVAKLEKDLKQASGVSKWDHDAVVFALAIYGSPLADTLEKPGSYLKKLQDFARAPTMTLEELTARRRKP